MSNLCVSLLPQAWHVLYLLEELRVSGAYLHSFSSLFFSISNTTVRSSSTGYNEAKGGAGCVTDRDGMKISCHGYCDHRYHGFWYYHGIVKMCSKCLKSANKRWNNFTKCKHLVNTINKWTTNKLITLSEAVCLSCISKVSSCVQILLLREIVRTKQFAMARNHHVRQWQLNQEPLTSGDAC